MQTLYNSLAYPPDGKLTAQYLTQIHEYELFRPLLEMVDVNPEDKENPLNHLSRYCFYFIRYIVNVFSKESPYNKLSDTLRTIQERVCKDIGFPDEIKDVILNFKLEPLEKCISMYINRETDEFVQQYMVCRNIHALNLQLSSQTIDRFTGSLIEPKSQEQYFNTAEKFRDKMYQLKQEFSKDNYQFMQMVNDFRSKKNNTGLHIEDIIPF